MATAISLPETRYSSHAEALAGGLGASPAETAVSSLDSTAGLCAAPRWKDDRHALIANAAFLIAASRRFAPGRELDDWLVAAAQVDARLAGEWCIY